jgi:hypothetical protein
MRDPLAQLLVGIVATGTTAIITVTALVIVVVLVHSNPEPRGCPVTAARQG